MLKFRLCVLLLVCSAATAFAASPLVLISIDGMRPDYITNPKACSTTFPTIQSFLTTGTYAEGVTGVLPTLTYPSHTTLITGVEPAKHGIWGNTTFDPESTNFSGWYWYAKDIKADTLWDAATRKKLITANVGWPVSVDERNIRFNIPEYWRAGNAEDRKLLRALSTPELYDGVERHFLSVPESDGAYLATDVARAKAAIYAIEHKHARFVTLHLITLDEMQHEHSPFSPQACQSLLELDKQVGAVLEAAIAANPATVVAVVSDHGFARTDYRVNLMVPLIEAGLLKLGTHAKEWKAAIFPGGGTAAIVLHDPKDKATEEAVRTLLHRLASNRANGIASILEKPEIDKLGGFPNAAFVVDLQVGYQLGYAAEGALVTPAPSTGMHGYLPSHPEMLAAFFVRGRGIAAGRDLGVIDMRQIAPTLGGILGVNLKDARQPQLNIRK
ncbi:MAG: alkaline phosphatase family protein [Acidobacteria bacterium]|nr:MAG: alkaline phosphatase family protein [Acidobacteriota bacterium]